MSAIASVPASTTPSSDPAPSPTVSVIIVSYWTGPVLMRSVMSAIRQPEVSEVIVVDNGNWPDEMARLKDLVGEDYRDRLTVLSGHGNIGYAAGCNLGAKSATGSHLFLLNPDAILPENAVAELLADGTAQEGPWVIGGRLINPDGTEQAGSRRGPLTPWTAFVEMTKLYHFAPRHPYFRRFNNHQDPCPEGVCETPVISGACMLMPRETFELIDGMDEAYFLHVEDVDFCLRLAEAGGRVFFSPRTDILHFKSSSRADRPRVEWRKANSMVRYFWTHFRKPYPTIFLAFVSLLVWVGVAFRVTGIIVRRALGLFGIRVSSGKQGLRKARRLARQRIQR